MIGRGPRVPLGTYRQQDGTWGALCWAPRAHSVAVVFDDTTVPLEPADAGYFTAELGVRSPGARYWLELDGRTRVPDPASRWQPDGVAGPSALFDPSAFRWTDEAFEPPALRDFVLYELHVGTFRAPCDDAAPGGRRPGTFATAAEALSSLAALGVTAVEPMPIAAFPGSRNWGYDGVFPFAPQETYGGPMGFMAFVDAAHAAGLAVVLDVVYNHFGPEGSPQGLFGPYASSRYATPWGDAINVDGPDSDEVRRYFCENAFSWFVDFHVDGLRLDAIHGILDTSPHPFLAELSEFTGSLADALDRQLVLIAESADNNPLVLTPTIEGGLGMDAQWADDFHHALHVALTGEQRGYYADYVGTPDLAAAIESGFSYTGQYSTFRQRRHGRHPRHATPAQFTVAVQNHDQVGNRPGSERLASLVSPDALRVAAGVLCSSPQMPLLFMGEEDGERAPFAYFVDHADPALRDAVRRGRREEMGAADALDPAAPETFAASCLTPATNEPHRLALRALYRDLLAFRHAAPIVTDPAAETRAKGEDGLLVVERRSSGAALWFACTTTSSPRPLSVPPGRWRLVVDTAARAYGGPGATVPEHIVGPSDLVLPGLDFVCYLEEDPDA